MGKRIEISCQTGHELNPLDLIPLQNESFKELVKQDFDKLRNEILEDFAFPFFVWKDPKDAWYIVDGVQRHRVLKHLIIEEGAICEKVPVVPIKAENEKDAKRRVLQVCSQYGKMTDQGLYEMLAAAEIEFNEMNESFRFPEIEFDKFEVEYFNETKEGLIPDDEIPEAKKSICKTGDLWQLGNHRLLCGDATKREDADRLMGGEKADMVFTDPPYGVSYSDKNAFLNTICFANRIEKCIENDHQTVPEMFKLWSEVFFVIAEISTNTASYYICSPQGGELMMMMQAIDQSPWNLKHTIIWNKNNHVLGRSDYNYKHEPILYGWRKNGTHVFHHKGQHKTSVWDIDKPLKSDLHPTMKPIELIENALLNSSEERQLCIDPFLGSGSTLIACEKTGRRCFGMEIDPHYCDVIIERWAQFTGKKAVRVVK